MKLIVATNNKDKLVEFKRILEPIGFEVLSQKDAGIKVNPEENGSSFAENAKIKAMAAFKASGCACVADDSGICVDALDGRPGIYSARYMGEDAPQEIKNASLLDELKDVPQEKRGAQYVCAICCILQDGSVFETEGICRGEIGYEPIGDGGFGYDPIFMANGKSYSQISGEEKDLMSHRGKALRELHKILSEKFNSEK